MTTRYETKRSDVAPCVRPRKRGEVSCEWCSQPATRYARFGTVGTLETTTDVVDLCDSCAIALRRAITRTLGEARRSATDDLDGDGFAPREMMRVRRPKPRR